MKLDGMLSQDERVDNHFRTFKPSIEPLTPLISCEEHFDTCSVVSTNAKLGRIDHDGFGCCNGYGSQSIPD